MAIPNVYRCCDLSVVLLGLFLGFLPHGGKVHWQLRQHRVSECAGASFRREPENSRLVVCHLPMHVCGHNVSTWRRQWCFSTKSDTSLQQSRPSNWGGRRSGPDATLRCLHVRLGDTHLRSDCVLDLEPSRMGLQNGRPRFCRRNPGAHLLWRSCPGLLHNAR